MQSLPESITLRKDDQTQALTEFPSAFNSFGLRCELTVNEANLTLTSTCTALLSVSSFCLNHLDSTSRRATLKRLETACPVYVASLKARQSYTALCSTYVDSISGNTSKSSFPKSWPTTRSKRRWSRKAATLQLGPTASPEASESPTATCVSPSWAHRCR